MLQTIELPDVFDVPLLCYDAVINKAAIPRGTDEARGIITVPIDWVAKRGVLQGKNTRSVFKPLSCIRQDASLHFPGHSSQVAVQLRGFEWAVRVGREAQGPAPKPPVREVEG